MHKYEEVEVFGLSHFNDLNVHYLLFFSLFFKDIEKPIPELFYFKGVSDIL